MHLQSQSPPGTFGHGVVVGGGTGRSGLISLDHSPLPLSSPLQPCFSAVTGSGSVLPLPPCPQPLHRQWRGALTTQLSACFPSLPPPPGPEVIPRAPSPIPSQGSGLWVVGKAGLARAPMTYDHGAIEDLLNEALLLQLTGLEVERAPAARQRQQLPQQQRQGQSGCPCSAPSQPGTGAGPRACVPQPRHFPRRVGGSLRPACGDCEQRTDCESPECQRALPQARSRTRVAAPQPASKARSRTLSCLTSLNARRNPRKQGALSAILLMW